MNTIHVQDTDIERINVFYMTFSKKLQKTKQNKKKIKEWLGGGRKMVKRERGREREGGNLQSEMEVSER